MCQLRKVVARAEFTPVSKIALGIVLWSLKDIVCWSLKQFSIALYSVLMTKSQSNLYRNGCYVYTHREFKLTEVLFPFSFSISPCFFPFLVLETNKRELNILHILKCLYLINFCCSY